MMMPSRQGFTESIPSRPLPQSSRDEALYHKLQAYASPAVNSALDSTSVTSVSTPLTSASSDVPSPDDGIGSPGRQIAKTPTTGKHDINIRFQDLDQYIALGCLHYENLPLITGSTRSGWTELLHPDLPQEVKDIIGSHAARLLAASWIKMFIYQPTDGSSLRHSIVRTYLLPEDWGRRTIDRTSKSLKSSLRVLLQNIDVSPTSWSGEYNETAIKYFDPWATAENVSLYYLFNMLPSPDPKPEMIKDRYSRRALEDLLDSTQRLSSGEVEQPLEGLKTSLYPYQARSASLMIQREAAPQLQLDPRLEVRESPNGKKFFFGARDGSFLHEPRYYEANRGGILAETMGLGKTIICLSVILATRGHLPRIPPAYFPAPKIRDRVGSLKDMAASNIGRHGIPAKDELEREEKHSNVDLRRLKEALEQNVAHYEVPADVARLNRNTIIPPPRQLVTCSGTIIVVPRNLLHQWQSEIRKHLVPRSLKVLVVDTTKAKAAKVDEGAMVGDFCSTLPAPTKLMEYDIVLFTRNRFEQEIGDGADDKGRRPAMGVKLSCQCAYIGATRMRDCTCPGKLYESPLKKLHWLRIIIDEGHSFSSSVSNAVLVAKQLQAERRWVVSGTPAKNLVGVEVDLATLDEQGDDPSLLRELTIEQRKAFTLDDENTKAAKALGSLASNFLMVSPWSESSANGRLDWDDYIYRHEHQYRRTYSGFSSCFLRTLEGLVVKTRPGDVERDITLPPMTHDVVYVEPCWFDKMTANLFIQVLRANAITSERSDVDYLFHKNSVKARHSLIRNLRQSNFTWTGFGLDDVQSTLETSSKYLEKEDKKCSPEDAQSLLESSHIVGTLAQSESWQALSRSHEVGLAVEGWPQDSEPIFSLTHPEKPAMVGITQLLEGQLHVDSNLLAENPAEGLDIVGQAVKEKLAAMAAAENDVKGPNQQASDGQMKKAGVPSSCVSSQPLTSRRASTMTSKTSPQKQKPKANTSNAQSSNTTEDTIEVTHTTTTSPVRPKKRKLTLSFDEATLAPTSPLAQTHITGTTSAKLSYLIDTVSTHASTSKILIFYDGDNAAYYIAQALEALYINHRIYARTLDSRTRAAYVELFASDPTVRVLLIDVACGAHGLNLNAANIVLIVNPINRPSIEAQAIKRAHRIGQTKPVRVETLVLKGTIEEEVFKQAKRMSRQQHLEARELEDDAGVMRIIQEAKVLRVEQGEELGDRKFAKLKCAQRVFGREGRHAYQRFGNAGARAKEGSRKKVKGGKEAESVKSESASVDVEMSRDLSVSAFSPSLPPAVSQSAPAGSLFGGETSVPPSLFGGSAP